MACDDIDINPDKQTCSEAYPTDTLLWCKPCRQEVLAAKEALDSGTTEQ
jgi:hypothetical protein